jgi:2-polyprenyl-3-methyl-5-hydroxy-6-metoxy-1,4-benzoquinol methylase
MNKLSRLIDPVRAIWEESQKPEPSLSLQQNLLGELASYLKLSYAEVEHLSHSATKLMEDIWVSDDRSTESQVLQFYREPNYYLFELTLWHCLAQERRFLDSIICMKCAEQIGAREFLDFGCGVGSHSILMAKNHFSVSMFDVSEQLIDFAKWRMDQRGHAYQAFLGDQTWTTNEPTYDFILALDVIEHVANPRQTLLRIVEMLKTGGLLCISVPPFPMPGRPMHLDYYGRQLRSDAKIFGLRHIKTLTHIDIFVKETVTRITDKELQGLPPTTETLVDRLFRQINPLVEKIPNYVKRPVGATDRALTALRQTLDWYIAYNIYTSQLARRHSLANGSPSMQSLSEQPKG